MAEEQANKERYRYYTQNPGTYNYGESLENNIYAIRRRSDNRLLHKFSTVDFKSLIKPVLTGKKF